MLTLKELKKIVKVADVEKRIPSVKSLKEHKVVVKEMINMKLKTIMRQIRNRSDSLRIQENRKEEKRLRKKKNKKTVADTGYKKVDRKEKKKKEKQEEKRRQKKLSVQQSIAYKEMGRDGICRVQGKTYSKCIRFYDINYQLAQNEDKNAIFENWCDFLNYFDSSIHFQLSFINHKSSMKEFEQVIRIRPQEDAFDDVRMEYAKMLKQQLAKGNNGLVKSKYITFSIEADNIREAKPKLERIESDILNNFKILGVPAYPLNGVERLQMHLADRWYTSHQPVRIISIRWISIWIIPMMTIHLV